MVEKKKIIKKIKSFINSLLTSLLFAVSLRLKRRKKAYKIWAASIPKLKETIDETSDWESKLDKFETNPKPCISPKNTVAKILISEFFAIK